MTMGTYTKIFMQFEEKFWFDSQVRAFLFLGLDPCLKYRYTDGPIR